VNARGDTGPAEALDEEISAGGVVFRQTEQGFEVALIRPRGRSVWALPKGHLDPGEGPEDAAVREVREETGLTVALDEALGQIHYAYPFRGRRISKRVHFFLFRYLAGEIDALEPSMRVEVTEARWISLAEARKRLTYAGEREVLDRARALLLSRLG
jgi:8-oxo-dGTP pyrophosphatase MutT (NUDIX family)